MGESSYTFHYLDFEAPSWKSFSIPKLFSSAHVWLLFVFEPSDVVQRGFWGRDLSLSRTHAQSLFLHVYWFDKATLYSLFSFFSVLVDKDNNPQWSPGSLEEVSQGKVNSYFEPLGERDLLL